MPLHQPYTSKLAMLKTSTRFKQLMLSLGGSLLISLGATSAFAETQAEGITGMLPVAPVEEPVETKVTAENMHVTSEAIQEWDSRCMQGDLEACNILGQLFLEQQIYPQAATYFEKVCYSESRESSKACAALTTLLTYDNYNMLDITKGHNVAKYLCEEKGVSFGCLALSQLYLRPELKDANSSFDYAQKACELNDATGCKQVALTIYSQAFGQRDIKKAMIAFEFYKKACELGDADSCETYGPHQEKLQQFQLYIERTQQQEQSAQASASVAEAQSTTTPAASVAPAQPAQPAQPAPQAAPNSAAGQALDFLNDE